MQMMLPPGAAKAIQAGTSRKAGIDESCIFFFLSPRERSAHAPVSAGGRPASSQRMRAASADPTREVEEQINPVPVPAPAPLSNFQKKLKQIVYIREKNECYCSFQTKVLLPGHPLIQPIADMRLDPNSTASCWSPIIITYIKADPIC
jgi:hypothetical protein